MICQHCNQNQATISLQFNINGQRQEVHLCPACAEKLRRQYMGGMWPGAMGQRPGFNAEYSQAGFGRRDFPNAKDEDLSRRRELGALEVKMKAAVSCENYEEAAQIRDRIKRIKASSIEAQCQQGGV